MLNYIHDIWETSKISKIPTLQGLELKIKHRYQRFNKGITHAYWNKNYNQTQTGVENIFKWWFICLKNMLLKDSFTTEDLYC